MVFHYRSKHEIHVLNDGAEGDKVEYNKWEIIFQFSTVAFCLLWLYHVIAFVSRRL